MATLWMLCGIPGSGKSTWIKNQGFDMDNTVILSTDDIIEREAKLMGKTYSEAFRKVKGANVEMMRALKTAGKEGKDIVWDQTNVSAKSRKPKLDQVPEEYNKIAVFFPTPDADELKKRLNSRPGKTIPPNVVMGMASQLEKPTLEEGFESIIVADNQ